MKIAEELVGTVPAHGNIRVLVEFVVFIESFHVFELAARDIIEMGAFEVGDVVFDVLRHGLAMFAPGFKAEENKLPALGNVLRV